MYIKNVKKDLEERVVYTVCNYFGVTAEEAFTKGRGTLNVDTRKTIYYFLDKYTELSKTDLSRIGGYFKIKQDRTTVFNAVQQATFQKENNAEYARHIRKLDIHIRLILDVPTNIEIIKDNLNINIQNSLNMIELMDTLRHIVNEYDNKSHS